MQDTTRATQKKQQAQAVIELAVFGAVLFFLIGGIVMNYVGSTFQQNIQLQAMRKAMLSSFRSSQAAMSNRTSASYVLYEDRLTGEFGRYNNDRSPVVAAGSGMMTFQAMRPLDWPTSGVDIEKLQIPVADVVINGKHFEFRMAGFVQYDFWINASSVPTPLDSVDAVSLAGSGLSIVRANPHARSFSATDCAPGKIGGVVPGAGDYGNIRYFCGMNDEAKRRLAFEWMNYQGDEPIPGEGDMTANDKYPPFYTRVVGTDPKFQQCGDEKCAWDYDRNGIFPDDLHSKDPGAAWVWCWSYKSLTEVQDEIDANAGSYPAYDIDGDTREETVFALSKDNADSVYRHYTAKVLDQESGDVDLSQDPADVPDPFKRQGMMQDMRIYAQTQCGATSTACTGDAEDDTTYFDVKEGKYYSYDTNEPVSVSKVKKNTLDIVERIYNMNPNMIDPEGFYCHNGVPGAPMPAGGPKCTCKGYSSQQTIVCPDATGSVEVMCEGVGCCFAGAQGSLKTCFESTATTKKLYIRSIINDKRARKWITAMDQNWNESLGAQQ